MSDWPVNMANDGGDVSGDEIAKMLPNATTAFDVTFSTITDYTEFYQAVYEARNDGDPLPYRFGSY